MTSSAEQLRAWSGPAILSFGFRPFFLSAGLWAALIMALWIPMLSGRLSLPTAFDPLSWHAHEALFGYLGAVVAGFLLTAVPNWTGRLPLVGWPLFGLFALWLLGRVAVAVSALLPAWTVGLVDLAFLGLLAAVILREILAGKNWRNLIVLLLLGALIAGNVLFHWEAAGQDGHAASGLGLRLGLAAAVMMIAVIGGRIVPSFTRNWLVRRGATSSTACSCQPKGPFPAPFGAFDKVVLLISLFALLCWVAAPAWPGSGIALLAAGLALSLRLGRWQGLRTGAEPLVWILHVGYAFLPLGMFALGTAILWPGALTNVAAQHLWMAGGIGVMTLAVMTRATLGHSGRDLTADAWTTRLYLLVIASVIARLLGGLLPDWASTLYALSAALWCAGFAGFALLYGPLLIRRRREPR
ncbi:NnrS family protein [Algihabitans albus]|uniref:NnrS family protein n=1 Tax=Algihabitans albus TaxID=2164067 RepID=UPI000E5DA1BF|nr:NnrS family protein [Algihabitans albus]